MKTVKDKMKEFCEMLETTKKELSASEVIEAIAFAATETKKKYAEEYNLLYAGATLTIVANVNQLVFMALFPELMEKFAEGEE